MIAPAPIANRSDAAAFLDALEFGEIRAATRINDHWQVHASVKSGILNVFRLAENVDQHCTPFAFRDRDLLLSDGRCPPGVRIVPGGSMVRRGAHLARGVVVMPPAYVNIGAFVDEDTMIDSHVLVGSCAQIGRRVHLSAGVQIGGVLEPIGAMPVIIEDDAFIGGQCGVYDGVRIGARAVLAAGVVLTASTPVFDLVHGRSIRPAEGPLAIPPNAVVVAGTRPARGNFAGANGLALSAAIIVKYRDDRTDARTALETALR
jgi:2,3,4,5-tetrahydropyridine-2-carboxylate N-succinyltransferase